MAVNEHDAEGARPEDARIGALYRSASLEQPPERLDRIVHDEARRALSPAAEQRAPTRSAVEARRPPWWHAWRLPLTFASLAVFSVSIVIIAQREGGEPLKLEEAPKPVFESPYQPPAAPSAAPAAPSAADAASFQRSEPTSGSSTTASPKQQKREAELAGSAQAPAVSSPLADLERRGGAAGTRAPEPFPGVVGGGAERRDAPSEPVRERLEQERAPAPPAAAVPPAHPAISPEVGPAPARPEQFAPPPAPAKPAPPPPPPAPKAAPGAAAKPEAERPAAKSTIGVRGLEASPPPTLDERPAARPRMAAPAPAAQVTTVGGLIAELEGQAPRQWLDRILALRAHGRRDDADALLREFERRYPHEPLPHDLQ